MRPLFPFMTLWSLFCLVVPAQTVSSFQRSARAAAVRVEAEGRPGPAFVTVGGQETRIASEAWKAWLVQGGKAVLYSSPGSGGYENEGQTLYSYDIRAGRATKLLSATKIITGVEQVRSRRGQLFYLVRLTDGAVGAPSVAIVHPTRGAVYRRDNARAVRVVQGRVTLALYKRGVFDGAEAPRAKPLRTQVLDLDRLPQASLQGS